MFMQTLKCMHTFPHVVILYLDVLAPQSRSTIYHQHFCNISSGQTVIVHHYWSEPCPSKESVAFVLNCQGQKFHVDDCVIDLDHHNYRLASIFQVKYNRETLLALAMLNFAYFHMALYQGHTRQGGSCPPPPPVSQAIVTNNAYTVSYLVIFECSAVSCHNGQHTNFSIQQETNSASANLIENTF